MQDLMILKDVPELELGWDEFEGFEGLRKPKEIEKREALYTYYRCDTYLARCQFVANRRMFFSDNIFSPRK